MRRVDYGRNTTSVSRTDRNAIIGNRAQDEDMSESDRAKSPSAGQWSAAQVVDHLVLFEESLLARHKKAIEGQLGETGS